MWDANATPSIFYLLILLLLLLLLLLLCRLQLPYGPCIMRNYISNNFSSFLLNYEQSLKKSMARLGGESGRGKGD